MVKRLYLETITGRRRGPLAATLKTLLCFGTFLYFIGHGLRRALYRLGLLRAFRLPVPVISVGNLTAGGTGKTPFVEYLAQWAAHRNLRTIVLSRGYGRFGPEGHDDEDLLSQMEIENVVRLTGKNRALLARRAVLEFHPDLVILDDGFQHYRLHRDLDILLIDATNPWAQGRLIPLGLLRERPVCAARADLIVLSRCDQVPPEARKKLADQLDRLTGGKPILETAHKPVCVRLLSSRTRRGLEWLKNRTILGFCGIGNPDAFRHTLELLGAKVVHFLPFDDHHLYTERDAREINTLAQEFMVDTVVTTEKDALKLNSHAFDFTLAALTVEIEVLRGEEDFHARLRALIDERLRVAGATAAP